jgi:aminopeptidase
MYDPRVRRLADLLTNYCIGVRKNDRVLLQGPHEAEPLILSLLEYVLAAGGHPHLLVYPDRYWEVFMRYATEHQLSFTPTFELLAYTQFEAMILVFAHTNTRRLNRISARSNSMVDEAWAPIMQARFDREASGKFRRVNTAYPTEAYAQDTGMGLEEFHDLLFRACHVNDPQDDPITFWQQMARDNDARVRALEGRRRAHLQSPDCDLEFSLAGRTFVSAAGKINMPDGEIFTGPVEDSASGRIRFTYPSRFQGAEVAGVELVFKEGKVVQASADVGEPTLNARLQLDEGASKLGEFGIGTNYAVTEPTGMILIDEKMGGSIHLALGLGYPATGNNNKSGIHWDLIADFSKDAEISLDGEVVYRDGRFIQ